MALDAAGLESDLAAISDPATVALAAMAWADAVELYAAGVIPASTTVAAAAATLEIAIVSAFGQITAAATASALEAAFLVFATTVAGGMLPTHVGAPPAGLVGFLALLTTDQDSQDDMAEAWADAIDAWAVTGTAVLQPPPNPVINWS
jgi:hypothetical protein